MTFDPLRITIVIPARNAETDLARLLRSIDEHVPESISFDVIIVDNGSTDTTRDVAASFGSIVLEAPGVTISELRNLGVERSLGDIIVFFDSDVEITHEWAANIENTLKNLESNPKTVAGSWYAVPPDASWLERSSFEPLEHGNHTHVNGGHLIIRKDFFNEIGGFSANFETGEDYEFCIRAQQLGAAILNDPALEVYHHGYPATLSGFIKREIWHGKGDFKSLGAFVKSKVAILAVLVVAMEITALVAALGGHWVPAVGAVVTIAAVCALASFKKYSHAGLRTVLRNIPIFLAYFNARALSLISRLRK